MNRHIEFETAGLMFDAALGRASWHDVGAQLVQLVEGATLTFIVQYPEQGLVDPIDVQEVTTKELDAYAAHFAPHDLWVTEARRRRLHSGAMLGTDLVSDTTWRDSVIYNELCRPNTDVFHGIMTMPVLSDGGVAALGIHRPSSATPFRREATGILDRMLPHIDRALQVRSRLRGARIDTQTSTAVLDNLSHGLIQLGPIGRMLHANKAAQGILHANDGLSLGRSRIRAALVADDARLQRSIATAAARSAGDDGLQQPGGYLRISRPSGKRAYTVVVSPIGLDRLALTSGHPAVMLLITDPEDGPRLSMRALQELFGLTPAEARIVAGLASGEALPQVAQSIGTSFETARTHLARARAKTETSSQVDLVRMVMLALAAVAPK